MPNESMNLTRSQLCCSHAGYLHRYAFSLINKELPVGEKRGKIERKSGRKFENLVGWIQKCVHDKAEIKVNDRIRDVDTDKLRQVDISIQLSDGPTDFLGIVEVRDRKQKIGVRYVEELNSKRRSVKADAIFLVSRIQRGSDQVKYLKSQDMIS